MTSVPQAVERLREALEQFHKTPGDFRVLGYATFSDLADLLTQYDAAVEALREYDRFQREDLGYSGPDDPALDPACAEQWAKQLAILTNQGEKP